MQKVYDVLIIGGGIHGVGVAQASAAAGYSTLLLEKSEIASETSSKSSKLIHGGLRYLESAQFSLVRECLKERELLLKNAPELVKLKPFYLPVYNFTSRRSFYIAIGLFLYSLLSGFKKSASFRKLKKSEWKNLDGLNTNNLIAVYQYFDAQTDDKLLANAVMSSAKELGAKLVLHAQVVSAKKEADSWTVNYAFGSEEISVKAKVIVNASGPWVNQMLSIVSPKSPGLEVDFVQGSHIYLANFKVKGIYYLEVPEDKRAVFIMPWKEGVLIGTTEKKVDDLSGSISPTEEEVEYLLRVASLYFPNSKQLSPENISDKFAGLRVLPVSEKNPFSRSRETIVFEDKLNAPGLFTIYGGKLTAYRATAEKVIKRCREYLGARRQIADTAKLILRADN